jgi:uncharacterized protein (DUF433 family)
MQAIEFAHESDDGVIKIPERYKDWFKKPVKVILLATDSSHLQPTNWNTDFSTEVPVVSYPHITRNPEMSGGEPIIKGTRTTVRTLVGYYKMGLSEEEILRGLTHILSAELHSALAYYFDNQAEIEGDIAKNNDYAAWQKYLDESEHTHQTWHAPNEN